MVGVFDAFFAKAWPYRFATTLKVRTLCGGVPADPKVAEAWLKSKAMLKDEQLQQAIAELAVTRKLNRDEAVKALDEMKGHIGFKADETTGELFIEGRQIKAAIKEAVNIAVNAGKLTKKYGVYLKGTNQFVPEHIVVLDDRIPLGVKEPTGIDQRFVHTWRGDSIKYVEYITEVDLHFTIACDWPFTDTEWAMIWLTGQEQGIGADRSQGAGRYTVVQWDKMK